MSQTQALAATAAGSGVLLSAIMGCMLLGISGYQLGKMVLAFMSVKDEQHNQPEHESCTDIENPNLNPSANAIEPRQSSYQ